MTVAEDLLRRHLETLVADNARWQTLIAENVVWELPFAPALGHPSRVVGTEVKGEGLIKATGRVYRQEYVVFLRAAAGKIAFLREYFDPTRASKAMNTPILDRD